MKESIKLSVPLFVDIPRKTKKNKRVYFNLNVYRNLNFFTNNQVKSMFKDIVKRVLSSHTEPLSKISITYTLFRKDKRRSDISNVLCIIDKFFCDAFVELGFIEDDDYTILPEVNYRFGGIDKDNPRVEIEVKELQD